LQLHPGANARPGTPIDGVQDFMVTITADDPAGLQQSCTFPVSAVDNTRPSYNQPSPDS
jgi:hypothetical protein